MTAPSLTVCSTDKDESKHIVVHETFSQNCSVNKYKSKQSITNETLSQNYSTDMDKLCSTEEDKSDTLQRNKNTQGMRLHMMCLVLTTLIYLNAEETILTCYKKECIWPLQEMNTLRKFFTI